MRVMMLTMRTTIDLPEDLHRLAISLSRDLQQSLSVTVVTLMRRGLRVGDGATPAQPRIQLTDGFPVISLGRPTSSEDVRSLDNLP